MNYDVDSDSWTSLLSKMKQIPEISEECSKAFQKLSSLNIKNCEDFDALATSVGYTDDNFVKFLKDTNYSEKTLENYQQYMQKANSATSAFSATLKSVAANMAIMLAINVAIKAVTWVWDKFNTTVAEAQSDLDETQSTISSLKTQIEELEKIDANALTQGQKDKLENLKEQLKVQEQLEEIEKRRLARETVGTGNFADYFDKDSYKNAYVGIMKDLTKYQGDIDGIAPLYEKRAEKTKRLSTLVDAGLETGTDVTELQESLRKAEEKQDKTRQDILKLQESLISSKADIQVWINTIEGFISDGSLVGEDLTEANNNLQELYGGLQYVNNELQRTNTLLYGGDDSWENVLAEKTMYSMKNLKDYGFSEDELKILSTLEFDKNASISELRGILDETQKVADENPVEPKVEFSKTQMIDTINSMADGFDVLDDIYADVLDGDTFDFTKLDTSKFSEAFSEITPEYEKFIETVSSSPTDIEACQGAFNDLVSAFIDSKGILESVDEETKQLTIDMLENMGVVNAEEVVMSALNAKLNEFADAKSVCASAGIDLANATRLEILELMREQEMSEETRISLWRYQMQKALSNENGINTVYDCVQLENLARAAGYTGSALIYLGKIKALLNKIENDKLDEDSLGYESVMGQVKNYNGLLQQLLSTEVATTKATVNYGGATKTAAAAQDKLKDSTKKATDALEKQKEVLNEQKSELEALHGAIIDYIDDEIDDINDKTDAIDKQNEKLRNQLDIYDDIISAVTNNIDIEIDAIDDKIDKLRDSNDEEERAIQLEQARQKLLEARSRKTLLVYTKNAGFTYQTDLKNIREQEENLANLEQEEIINSLEKEKELLGENKKKWLDIADAREKALQAASAAKYFGSNWRDTTLNPSDEMIGKLQGDYVGTQIKIEQNDSRIEELNKEKEFWENEKKLWQDALDEYEKQQNRARLESFFGSDYEYQLLNNSASWRKQYVQEYSRVCAEIEALEERIKTSSETTTSSVESGANRISNAANGVKDSMDSMKQSYKWTEADTADLDFARARLEALNTLIGQGRTELTDARDKVAAFVEQYAQLEDSRIVTDNLKSSVSDLNGIYSETDTLFNDVLEGVDGRLSSMSSYVQEVDSSSQTLADNLSTASQAIQEMKTSEETIEAEAEETVSNVETTISNLLTKLGELQTKLGEISLSRTEIEAIADEELLDTSIVVDGVHTKVGEIQTAITTLMESITPLEGALDALMQKLTTLDEVTLSNVISAFGGASGGEGGESKESGSNKQSKGKKGSEGESSGGGSGLLGAVKAVDEAIGSVDNEESLLGKLAQVDASTLENIIAQFGLSGENGDSEGANLLNAVNAVSQAIVGGGKDDENSLIASIEQLGSDPTIEHVTNVTESFNGLLETINNCITKLEDLASNITSLPSVSVDGYASGTRNAKKGLHEIAEEGAEIISDGTHAVLAQTPTLMNMKGGETVYNAKETEKILNGEGLKPIDALENYTAIREGVEIKRPEWILGDDDKTFTFAGRQITMKEFNALSEQLANRIQNTYPTFHRDVLNSMAVNKPFDYSNVPMNNNQQQTVIQINGDLSFPNIKSGNDAELLLKDLSNMANKARQRSARR